MTVPSGRSALQFPCGEAPAPGEAREVAAGVLWQRVPLPNGQTINAWALRDGEGWAVVDTGMATEKAMEVWRRLLSSEGPLGGRPVTRVIGTHLHADHVGLAGWLCGEFDCELWMTRSEYQQACLLELRSARPMSPKELAFYARAGWSAGSLQGLRPMGRQMSPMPVGFRRMQDGDRIRIGEDDWQVIVGSGHSPEHACLLCRERGLFISGDQVLPLISSNVSVWPSEPDADPMQEWLESIERIAQDVPADVLVLPAHDDPFRGLHARLQQLAHKRHRVLGQLRDALAQASLRAVDCFPALFGRPGFDNPFVQQLATGEAVAYLAYLVAQGEAGMEVDAAGVGWYRRPARFATQAA